MNLCLVIPNFENIQQISNFRKIYDFSEICEYSRYRSFYTNDKKLIISNNYCYSSENNLNYNFVSQNLDDDVFLNNLISKSVEFWNFYAYENPSENGSSEADFSFLENMAVYFLSEVAKETNFDFYGSFDFEFYPENFSQGQAGFIFKIENKSLILLNTLFLFGRSNYSNLILDGVSIVEKTSYSMADFNIKRNELLNSYFVVSSNKIKTNCCLRVLCYPDLYEME